MAEAQKPSLPTPIQETTIPEIEIKSTPEEKYPESWTAFETKKQSLLRSLFKSGGLMMSACKGIGYSHEAVRQWRKVDPAFDQAIKDAIEEADRRMGDIAEGELFKAVKAGDKICLMFYLKCKHKKRGYVERSELEVGGMGNRPIMFQGVEMPAPKEERVE